MVSTSTRLFLKTLPLHFMYKEWYRCLSIFLESRYFLRRRRSTRRRRIQITAVGIRALARPTLFPVPVWRPLRLAARCLRTLYLENLARLLNHKTVLCELADIQAGIGHGDLVDLIGVQPNLALATLEHGSREALLELERIHFLSAIPMYSA